MQKKIVNLVSAIFVGLLLGFYIIILSGLSSNQNVMTFLPVITAFIFSVVMLSKTRLSLFTTIALAFTVVSDVFLMLVTPRNQAVAMATFSVAQILHFLRLYFEMKSKKERLIHLCCRVAISVIIEVIAVIVVKQAFDIVVALSVFYFANLTLNVIVSFRYFKKSPYLAIGFLCFIMCDIFVGFSSAAGVYLNIPKTSILYPLAYPNFNYVHLFYVPSQTLIALSVTKYLKNYDSVYKTKNVK